ncbi:MAG: response regulator [Acidobacteriota bacterium]|nr:response regulator [Acidobacteriota bacterium]
MALVPGRSSGRTLLLVEDDRELRESLAELLKDSGFDVHGVENGREALDYLEGFPPPCLVLLDLMMPVMNGWEFREAQAKNEKLAGIPVVILTADGRADLKARALGVTDYLRKPIDVERLLGMVQRFGC